MYTEGTTTPLQQAQNRYGGVKQAQSAIDQATAYRAENPKLFPSSLDPVDGRNASPKIDTATMAKPLGVKTGEFYDDAGQKGGTKSGNITVSPDVFGRARETVIQHEAIHETDDEPITQENAIASARSAIRDANPSYKTENMKVGSKSYKPGFSNYLMNRKELNARLPRLNSMHMATGGAFPTSQEESEAIYNNFGFTRGDAPPKLEDKYLKELNRNPDVFDLNEAFWKMSKPERLKFLDEKVIRQRGQVKNSPQEKPLDAVV
jgi:hypothetical protein